MERENMGDQGPDLGLDRAHGARIYDYVLGGKDNYELDRKAAEASLAAWPAMGISMRANRAFMHRVGRFLAAERGIRQFLDIRTGIPPSPTCTRSCRPSHRMPASSTSTTTRSCSPTPEP
jgi:S-adenosyl methyltransferase